ncbi:UDP-N-acetylmuramoyl-L-alanine--D-glutamate ligase [Blochmannia endosymbiont of Polyrhachis (Hedomyrma) turneri]|uniref:UDP-N-acetylmuramoyl-L-alanine--D-glutamate ligase n=1 Tax=Blochmannia endosymbiont of Polyrhachis (Hedomyrma) turneri TaxID=1505596 RepID=UPI00061A66CC|nr:UDP-N-acetylmuramoyl-L-alanine--D-glutamate ligase [Blochmannia endosymbiont of Polyrhachis (Hedomyrma) turneri]AKC59723.1 UDP-N-acetylmuramoylalanine--D-glutamate ligase [Blochmannia endosymbiont of Polyrhachis (Hedomyrma) turneri]
MVNYRKARIVIVGLGLTGLSCVKFFLDRGVVPKVMDTQYFPRCLHQLPKDIKCCLGRLNEEWLLDATLIVVSPGVSLSDPILVRALNAGIEIIGDIELFVRETDTPIIAITGSSGKSTVVRLLSNMAICAGLIVGVGGNIGVPVLMLLNKCYQLYILEISSFQLETTTSLCSVASTILNISHDHMNRYSSDLLQYHTTKLKIYNNAKVCLVNASDPLTFPVSSRDHHRCYCVSFGDEFGDYHIGWQSDRYCLMKHNTLLLYCSEMKISGRHNYMNALAALALADIMMIPRKCSLLVLRNFSGLSHCLELVHEKNGIRWINDSKATNISSTIAAIRSVSIFNKGTLHILLGGDGKRVDFFPLGYWMKNDRISMYCFGKDAVSLGELRSYDDTIITESMEQSICIISTRVKKNDVVLLSPACSSLDQFESFKMRGHIFSQLVKKIG